MGKGQIAGILEGLGCLLGTMTGRTPAVQPLGTAGNLFGATAIERGFQCNGAAVQSGGHGQHLKCGARLIAIRNTAVSPLLKLGIGQCLLIGFFSPDIRFTALRVQQILQP